MRGIPEDKAVEIGEQIDSCKYLECSVKEWLRDECQELNPWIPLEEFLKSGFEGDCRIYLRIGYGGIGKFNNNTFSYRYGVIEHESITHVMPIHKPEPPR